MSELQENTGDHCGAFLGPTISGKLRWKLQTYPFGEEPPALVCRVLQVPSKWLALPSGSILTLHPDAAATKRAEGLCSFLPGSPGHSYQWKLGWLAGCEV